jgi:peptidoglycan biosynthesis protein MviN/MurJ (putative lipid II flippase)
VTPRSPSDTAPRRPLAVSTAIFTVFTALSRVIGLIRESLAAAFFGQGAAASAFTFASQIPNLLSNLFAQAALSAAFVPARSRSGGSRWPDSSSRCSPGLGPKGVWPAC